MLLTCYAFDMLFVDICLDMLCVNIYVDLLCVNICVDMLCVDICVDMIGSLFSHCGRDIFKSSFPLFCVPASCIYCILFAFKHALLFLLRISSVLSQGISHGM